MSKAERLRAAADLAEAEEAFAAKKAAGGVTVEDKHALRALRQAYRDDHRKPVADGAQPGAIKNKAKAKDTE